MESILRYLSCSQNDGPLLLIDYISAPNIWGYQKGILISGTPHTLYPGSAGNGGSSLSQGFLSTEGHLGLLHDTLQPQDFVILDAAQELKCEATIIRKNMSFKRERERERKREREREIYIYIYIYICI